MKKILDAFTKKTLVSLLMFVVAAICCINLCNHIVRASEGATAKTDVVNYINSKSAPTESGKIFAGWYADEEYTEPIKTTAEVPDAGAYAKFVDENVLSIKLQTKKITDENNETRTNMRVVTSVDSDQYYRVGFEIEFNNNERTVPYETYKIMERIEATAASGNLTYDYSPNVIDVDSEYFMSVTIANINSTKLDKCFYIRPYWKTLDGTKVYGVSRYVSVEQGESSTNINIPVKLADTTELQDGDSVKVSLTHYNLLTTNTLEETATAAKVENGYAHLNIPVTKVTSKYTSFNSATLITLQTANAEKAIYRNLQKSSKNVDVSWFRAYAQSNEFKDSKYVITTAADLYGFAELVNPGSDNIQEQFFRGREVQLCASIMVNSSDEFDATNVTSEPRTWNAIGDGSTGENGTSLFAGTFDGKNNTISGLYTSSDATYVGLFGNDNSDAIYKNFKLKNTYFKSTKAGGYIGGIVAYSKGNFDNISSDATILCTSTSECGGLIGQLLGDRAKTISNCQNTGTITTSGYDCGGLVGRVTSTGTATILNCENSGALTSSQVNFGGLIGRNGGSTIIQNCQNSGNMTASAERIGGIIGNNTAQAKIDSCQNIGSVSSAANHTGGIIGINSQSAEINKCHNSGDINSTKNNTGGIIGKNEAKVEIDNCQNSGTVTGSVQYIGGIIGINVSTVESTISNCLNRGNVIYNGTGIEPNIGGFIGRTEDLSVIKFTNSLNTGTVSLTKTSGPVVYFVGSVIGRVKTATVTFTNMYDTNAVSISQTGVTISIKDEAGIGSGVSANASDMLTGQPKIVDASDISGTGGYVWTKLDFREECIWAAIENDTPQLTTFATKTPMDLYGVHRIDIDWYNDTDTAFTITTADELYGVAYLVNTSAKQFNGKTITLGADIAINPGTWNAKAEDITKPEYSWTPIGVNRTFQGTFNGLDATTGEIHTISGLYATGSTQFLGLFGQANASSHICNLKLKNSYFQSTYAAGDGDRAFVGSVAGYTKGNVTTVYSDAVVEGQHFGIGGMIGSVTADNETQEKTISNCQFAGKVILNTTTGRRSGGLIGTVGAGGLHGGVVNVKHCLYTGTLTIPELGAGPQCGGIVGRIDKGSCTIEDSLSAGSIIGTNYVTQTGSIAGQIVTGATLILKNVYATTECISCTNPALSYDSSVTVGTKAGTLSGEAIAMANLAGSEGYQWTILDFDNYWVAIEEGVPQLISFQTGKAADVYGVNQIDIGWYDDSETEFTISTPAQLYGLAYLVNTSAKQFNGKTVYLGADITVNPDTWNAKATTVSEPEYSWTAIGTTRSFKGTFDGQNKTISGLYQVAAASYVGLFGELSSVSTGGVKNLRLENSYFEMTSSNTILIGGVVAFAGANITNVYSDAHVKSAGYYAGGIVGGVKGSDTHTISKCWFNGIVNSTGNMGRFAGGIVGCLYDGNTTIDNCLFTGEVYCDNMANSPQVGGLVGTAGNINNTTTVLTMQNCLSAGRITATGSTNNVASVLGNIRTNSTATFEDVYATNECWQKLSSSVYVPITVVDSSTTTATTGVTTVVEDTILGMGGSKILTGLDFASTWTDRVDEVPGITSLTEKDVVLDIVLFDTALKLWSEDVTNANTVDNGDGNYVYTHNGSISKTVFDNYCKKLTTNGYVKYEATATGLDNTVYNYLYQKGALVLSVTFAGNATDSSTGTVYISGSYGQAISTYLVEGTNTVSTSVVAQTVANTTFHMPQLSQNGNSFVIQLKNGHFVINDGGEAGEMEALITYLKGLAGTTDGVQNPVIIEAWTISHYHTDHIALFKDVLSNTSLLTDVYVEGVYVNQPSNAKCEQDDNPSDLRRQIALCKQAISTMRTTNGNVPQIYRYQAGQSYYFDDITMDVLFTQDLLAIQELSDGVNEFNDTSTWLKFTIEGKTVLVAGDAETPSIKYVESVYGDDGYLEADVFVAMHHGMNSYSDTIGLFAKGSTSSQILLIPQIDRAGYITDYSSRYTNLFNNFNSSHTYWMGEGTVYLTFSSNDITCSR